MLSHLSDNAYYLFCLTYEYIYMLRRFHTLMSLLGYIGLIRAQIQEMGLSNIFEIMHGTCVKVGSVF